MRPLLVCCVALTGLALCSCQRQATERPASRPAKGSTPKSPGEVVVGGLYAVKNADGTYSIEKVLAADKGIVHLRKYANTFPTRPEEVDSSKLTLGGISIDDLLKKKKLGPMGVGHFPLAVEGFLKESPVFLQQEPVKDEELEGYRMWLKQK